MELIRAHSKRSDLRQAFADLQKHLANSAARPRRPAQKPPRRHNRLLDRATIDELVAKYEAGESSTALVADYGIAKATVLKLLRTNGATIRRQGLTPADVKHAIGLYRDGRSLAWIGDQLSVSPMTVSSALKRSGITLRDPHGRER